MRKFLLSILSSSKDLLLNILRQSDLSLPIYMSNELTLGGFAVGS